MPKYLIQASYTPEGVKGLLKDGGSKRRAAAAAAVKGLGGNLEVFYFAFGDTDAYVVLDCPDNVSAAAASLAVNAAGGASCEVVVLLTPEEMNEAAKRSVEYRAPGS